MSKHNNVNPGQYKVAGSRRPGEDLPNPEQEKQELANQAAENSPDRKVENSPRPPSGKG